MSKNLKNDTINTNWIFLLVYDGSHSACGSILRESWDKIFKYLGSILDIIFSKSHILSNEDLPTMDLSVCGSIPQESWGTYFQKFSFKTYNKSIKLKPLMFQFRQDHTRLMGAVLGRALWGCWSFLTRTLFTNLPWFPQTINLSV